MLDILKKNITKEDKLTKVEFYKNKIMGLIPDCLGKVVHHKFVVFKTTGTEEEHYWWSIEKNKEHITIQRCKGETEKNAVKNKIKGKDREKVEKYDDKQYDGNGTIYDLLQYAVVYGIIEQKYHLFKSNCQQLVEFLSPKITAEEKKICGAIPCTFPSMQCKEVGKNDYLNNDVFNFPVWSPITAIIYMNNIQLLQKAFDDGKYDINDFYNGITPLNLAIFFSRTKMVEYLLNEMEADPTKCNNDGKSPIQMAAMFSTKGQEIIQLLLNKVDVNHQDKELGNTALHYAVLSSKSESTVEFLLKKGASPALANYDGDTALHLAALEENNTKIIDLLLKSKKVEINQQGKDGMTPLHYAISQSNLQCVRHLLDKGANPTIRDKKGFSPLDMAAQYGKDVKLIDLLLNTGKVNVNDKDIETKQTSLHCAASNSNALTAGYLIKIGADLKAVDKKGCTPFNLAVSNAKNKEIIDLFLDIEMVNNEESSGQTALHYAVMNSNVISARHLIEIKKADRTLVNNDKKTALHVAAAYAEKTEIIDYLFDENNINQANPDGMTPLHCAVEKSNLLSVRRLLKKGANPMIRDNNGSLPLDFAKSLFSVKEEIINLLLL